MCCTILIYNQHQINKILESRKIDEIFCYALNFTIVKDAYKFYDVHK